ncbi:MAG: hypothetical protein HFE39_01100 [Clostridiales bacterium]|nr:hypothetical protein [Clostridiales bacterium]
MFFSENKDRKEVAAMRVFKKGFGVLSSVLTFVLLFAGIPAGKGAPEGFVQTGDQIPYFIIGAVVLACIVVVLLLIFKKKPKD